MRAGVALALGVLLAGLARDARADDATTVKARAALLFDEGKELMKKGDFHAACIKFEGSERVDPAVGTELNLANCYEKEGRTASAWGIYREAAVVARRAHQNDRQKLAEARVAALAPLLPRIHVVLDAATAPADLVVRLDGAEIVKGEWDTPTPVDPGVHKVSASAAGRVPWSTDVQVAPGATADVRVPALATVAAPPVVVAVLPAAPVAPPPEAVGWVNGQRVAGLIVAGAGVVAAALGTVFGLDARSENDQALTHCPSSPACNDATGVSLTHQAQDSATFSTVAFVTAGVLAAGGAVLFFTAPSNKKSGASASVAPLLGPGYGGLTLEGSW